jgi:hypothetical protein
VKGPLRLQTNATVVLCLCSVSVFVFCVSVPAPVCAPVPFMKDVVVLRGPGDEALNFAEVRGFLSAVSPMELGDFDAVCGTEDAFKLSLWAHQLPCDLAGNLTFEGAVSCVLCPVSCVLSLVSSFV